MTLSSLQKLCDTKHFSVFSFLQKPLATIGLVTILFLCLPLLGCFLAGRSLIPYLRFEPPTRLLDLPPVSWFAFTLFFLFILVLLLPFSFHLYRFPWKQRPPLKEASFPGWGWMGLAICLISWILAWNRFPWFALFQKYTFTPLWLGYVLLMNGLAFRRTGNCLLIDRPRCFLFLFPLSSALWWLFEYLNRFVQNWHYVADQTLVLTPLEYWLHSMIAFSTVLPAFFATFEWISSFRRLRLCFEDFHPLTPVHPKRIALWILTLSLSGLFLLGVYPNFLFPLLWISPLLVIVSCQALWGNLHLFSPLRRGDWSQVCIAALAALVCGFFWEMWNYSSYLKWEYTIPYVHVWKIFEMPILGYAGYLGFGLECLVVIQLFTGDEIISWR